MGCLVFVIQYHDTNIKFYARTNLSEILQRDVFLSIIKFDSIETSHILLVILYHEDLYSLSILYDYEEKYYNRHRPMN